MNGAILGMGQSIKNIQFDLCQQQDNNNGIQQLFKRIGVQQKFDLIFANPPRITVSPLNNESSLDISIYDYKEQMLESCFRFAQQYLNHETKKNRKGKFLLIYSDISENIGIQQKGKIEELCIKFQLVITSQESMKLISDKQLILKKNDPLFDIKCKSNVILYEINRI
ncbi:hypothetical protein IMG5_199970 [Ichthyophthirius multifiliis]|uniref:Uncharacterized protein n=1 Tax=Ichthyophthirius multifiliis TaxID=5932 RepID=G0R5N8_ICHMU|nr:hypothetical protein IMG5_199970 [Ichthyophthirius multifiliis]EGR27211.1 hypothetical protein IMG5_199970 [Ichthyophthirius multifiliis]|eukprot:XP_004024095.1 hypothetical protein IMG5_199970 [Ichthyophthirius multifiliis]